VRPGRDQLSRRCVGNRARTAATARPITHAVSRQLHPQPTTGLGAISLASDQALEWLVRQAVDAELGLTLANGGGDKLNVVAVVDDGDRLIEFDEDVYWSPLFEHRGDVDKDVYVSRQARLLGIALTCSPATIALQPVQVRSGDLRSSFDRGGWQVSWGWRDPLLRRALDVLEQRGRSLGLETRAVPHVVDRRARYEEFVPFREGMAVPDVRHPGGLEYSAHRGRILRVY
jgi:hypothetical protein